MKHNVGIRRYADTPQTDPSESRSNMNTVFLLMAQFGSVTITMDQVRALLGGLAVQTIRNRVAAGKFPRPTSDGVWLVQDVADYLDRSKSAPKHLDAA